MCDQGHICIFDSKKCEIIRKDSEKLVGTAVRIPSNMYILENEEQCFMSQTDDEKNDSISGGDMLTWGAFRREPLSLLSKGENV